MVMWRAFCNFLTSAASTLRHNTVSKSCHPGLRRKGLLKGILCLQRCDRKLTAAAETDCPPSSQQVHSKSRPASSENRRTPLENDKSKTDNCLPSTASDWGIGVSIHLLGGATLETSEFVAVELLSQKQEVQRSGTMRTAHFLGVQNGAVCVGTCDSVPAPAPEAMSATAEVAPSLAKRAKQPQCPAHIKQGIAGAATITVSVSLAGRRGAAGKRRAEKRARHETKQTQQTRQDTNEKSIGCDFSCLAASNSLWKVSPAASGQGFHLRHASGYWLAFDNETNGGSVLQANQPTDENTFALIFPSRRPTALQGLF